MQRLEIIRNELADAKRTSERKHYKVSISELCKVVEHLILAMEDRLSAIEHAIETKNIRRAMAPTQTPKTPPDEPKVSRDDFA